MGCFMGCRKKGLLPMIVLMIIGGSFYMMRNGLFAQSPNERAGIIPPTEMVCNGFTGAAKGLCIAGCEAALIEKDTTSNAFKKVNENFKRKTGQDLPCIQRPPVANCLALAISFCNGLEPLLSQLPPGSTTDPILHTTICSTRTTRCTFTSGFVGSTHVFLTSCEDGAKFCGTNNPDNTSGGTALICAESGLAFVGEFDRRSELKVVCNTLFP